MINTCEVKEDVNPEVAAIPSEDAVVDHDEKQAAELGNQEDVQKEEPAAISTTAEQADAQAEAGSVTVTEVKSDDEAKAMVEDEAKV